MAIYKEDIVDINLETGNIHRSFLGRSIGTADSGADHFGVRVFRDGAAVSLSGVSVQGYFRDSHGNNIAITSGNSVSGNVATVVLPQACYNYEGQFVLAIKLVGGGVTGTVRIVDGVVDNTNTGGAVAPTSTVPTYQEVLALYEQAIAVVNNSVRYNEAQSLTDTQKAQARANISATSEEETAHLKIALDAIEKTVDFENVAITIKRKKYINISTLELVTDGSSQYWLSDPISVTPGDVYRITCEGYSIAAAYGFGNSGTIVSAYPSDTSNVAHTFKNKIIVVPDGVNQLYIADSDYGETITPKVEKAITLVVDSTLAIAGDAADAKATGDRVKSAKDIATIGLHALSPSAEQTAALTQTSDDQSVFFDYIPKGKYWFIIETDTAFTFTSFRFYQGGTSVVVVSDGGKADPNIPFIYNFDYSAGTVDLNRLRIYGVSAAANITLRFIEYNENRLGISNSIATTDYVGDFVTNKAANASWIDGKSIYAQSPQFIRTDANYSIQYLDVAKGDLIYIHFASADHVMSSSRYVLSERIIYGDGADQSWSDGIYAGGNGTEYIYIAEKSMKMTVCCEKNYKPNVYQYASKNNAHISDMSIRKFLRFPFNETTKKLAITKESYNGRDSSRPKPLTLLHFSDVHGNVANVAAIKEFKERYGSYLDDVICTGDMAPNYFSSYYPIFSRSGYQDILLAIGNHDVYGEYEEGYNEDAHPEDWATNPEKYAQYIAPSISEWGEVVQPENASTLGLCYYYKDYTSNEYGYRLIVLDAMAFDDTQYNWLVSALADAKSNNMTVVIAEHFAPIAGLQDVNGYDSPFMSMLTGMEMSYAVGKLTTSNGNSAVAAVDDFIGEDPVTHEKEGDFACWICGHMHYDQIARVVSHPNQIYIAVGSANTNAVWADQPRYKGTPSEDLFNIISIDPYLKVIKIQRIGATVDDWGRMHDYISINYQTGTMITTSK